jgi:hypothetical protein
MSFLTSYRFVAAGVIADLRIWSGARPVQAIRSTMYESYSPGAWSPVWKRLQASWSFDGSLLEKVRGLPIGAFSDPLAMSRLDSRWIGIESFNSLSHFQHQLYSHGAGRSDGADFKHHEDKLWRSFWSCWVSTHRVRRDPNAKNLR